MNVPGIILHANSHARLDNFINTPVHAVLLSGPTGTGKTYVAAALGAELLKIRPDELDRYAYQRIIKPKNNTITVEQIRELISFFSLRVPGTAQIKRIAILQDAETMGVEAQNALLKLLEEPPADSILILTSSQPDQLLTTIRSRVQHLQLPAPLEADILQHFIAAGHDEIAVRAALRRSGSHIAEAKQALEDTSNKPDTTIAIVKQALSTSQYERLLLVDAIAKQKGQAHLFADTLAIVATASLEAAVAKGADTIARWSAILQAASIAQDALERSGNAKLVLTELMLAL